LLIGAITSKTSTYYPVICVRHNAQVIVIDNPRSDIYFTAYKKDDIMLIYILITLACLSLILAVIASRQSSEFVVIRSAVIKAPDSVVFDHVNDLRKWQAWSPWARLDPDVKNTFDGPASGVGSSLSWVSANNKVGQGKMTIIDSQPNKRVQFKLEFIKPFQGTNLAQFDFRPEGVTTEVTWEMSGHKPFIMKLVGLFMNCDKMVGAQFEQGLSNLQMVTQA
jgi:hypothetical protein